MLDANRVVELATSLLHVIGGLLGAWVHVAQGDLVGSVIVSLTVAASILILAAALAASEIIRVKVRRYVRKHEKRDPPESRDKQEQDA